MSTEAQDRVFCKAVVQMRLLSSQAVDAARQELSRRRSEDPEVRIGTILLERGDITEDGLRSVVEFQRERLLYCERCEALYSVAKPERGRQYTCRRCSYQIIYPHPINDIDAEALLPASVEAPEDDADPPLPPLEDLEATLGTADSALDAPEEAPVKGFPAPPGPIGEIPTQETLVATASPSSLQASPESEPVILRSPPGVAAVAPEGKPWYLNMAGELLGPYAESELLGLIRGGRIHHETWIWRRGSLYWRKARQIDVLADLLAEIPPPVPAAEGPSPAADWYVAFDGKPDGPYTADELRVLARRGLLGQGSLVWKVGDDRWRSAREQEEFSRILRNTPPPVPGAAAEPLLDPEEPVPPPAAEDPPAPASARFRPPDRTVVRAGRLPSATRRFGRPKSEREEEGEAPAALAEAEAANKGMPEDLPSEEVSEGKLWALLSYWGPLWIVSFLVKRQDRYVVFHLREGVPLFVLGIAFWCILIVMGVGAFVLGIGLLRPPLYLLMPVGSLALLALAIVGSIHAWKGECKSLPLVGALPGMGSLAVALLPTQRLAD